jgi:hypothetical protein
MLRRVLAIAASLLLLNVSAAEALRVCAAKPHQAATATGEHQHHHDTAPKQAEKPVQSECCAAMSSCAVSIEIAGASDVSSAIPDGDRLWAALDGAPAGQVFSPDPPPPKHQA